MIADKNYSAFFGKNRGIEELYAAEENPDGNAKNEMNQPNERTSAAVHDRITQTEFFDFWLHPEAITPFVLSSKPKGSNKQTTRYQIS